MDWQQAWLTTLRFNGREKTSRLALPHRILNNRQFLFIWITSSLTFISSETNLGIKVRRREICQLREEYASSERNMPAQRGICQLREKYASSERNTPAQSRIWQLRDEYASSERNMPAQRGICQLRKEYACSERYLILQTSKTSMIIAIRLACGGLLKSVRWQNTAQSPRSNYGKFRFKNKRFCSCCALLLGSHLHYCFINFMRWHLT